VLGNFGGGGTYKVPWESTKSLCHGFFFFISVVWRKNSIASRILQVHVKAASHLIKLCTYLFQ